MFSVLHCKGKIRETILMCVCERDSAILCISEAVLIQFVVGFYYRALNKRHKALNCRMVSNKPCHLRHS